MKHTGLKALALKALQRNLQCNTDETGMLHEGEKKEAFVKHDETLTENECDAFEERAAIMQYDGGLLKEQAEERARELIRPLPLIRWCKKDNKFCTEVKQ